ncbi:Mediator of RNA polymerase II transcription subunit 14 [Raphanus sativus]|uniref:Mediator of RNA polymerase II transcription subunit 14 n=1 Tax=Raphanus sativus TaxID=3726 RepID=A0A6J0M498_RAPSA|nr:mediator of RNA polymerase II transcription subunit 14 isoform X2 [Raphanus sativus]KAJ4898519.1 Mediator of RNA polymerase II transcription subunit 14 [Raphanus sativus]
MAELGQQTVDFSALVGRTADESFLSLKEVVENAKSRELSDTDEKVSLLKYIVKTQQRMLRLNALANWCKQQARAPVYDVPSAVEILLTVTGSYQPPAKVCRRCGDAVLLGRASTQTSTEKAGGTCTFQTT